MIAPIDEDATHGAADEEMGMAEDSAPTGNGARAAVEHGWTNPGTTHHHHDHGRFDRVR